MKKGLFTGVLCLIVAAVIVVIGAFFIKSLGKDNTETTDKPETELAGDTQTESTDTPTDTVTDGTQVDAPVSNETDGDTTASNDTPVSNDGNSSSVSNTGGADAPSSEGSTQVSDGSQGESTPPSQPTEPAPAPETPPVTVPATAPTSYKDFSITQGMDAATAAAKLDEFLGSKYSILLNKQHKVGDDYAPTDLITPAGCSYPMERVAGDALVQLLSAARQNGINDLVLYSGYRTVASQRNKFETRTNKYLQQGYSRAEAEAKAGEYIAPPGASEHHTGLAADVCSSSIVNKYGQLVDAFDQTASYRWMRDNCTRFGFIIRYTKGDEGITGYSYEPWHLRYLGVEHATACTQLGLTYEEYYTLITTLRDQAKAEAGA